MASSSVKKLTPRSRQVVKFNNDLPMASPYPMPFAFELNPDYDLISYWRDYYDPNDEVDEDEIPNSREILVKHIKQVRDSLGFDVDCRAPSWFEGNFFPINVSKPDAETMEAVEVAMDEINAEMGGKRYELVKVEKLVFTRNRMMNFTLTAKEIGGVVGKEVTIQAIVLCKPDCDELGQWRFKPQPPLSSPLS